MQVIKLSNYGYDANSYLVNNSILIDVGMNQDSVIQELKKHINIDELETIILTHCHYDHSGAAKQVAKICESKIAIHKNDAPLLKDSVYSAATFFGKTAPSFTPDILLNGDEYFGDLKVIHTPGHTPGSISLYDKNTKILFSGDTVFPDAGFGRTDLSGGDINQLISSIEKLSSLDVKVMYPGHGDIVEYNANENIKNALMNAKYF